MSDMDEVGDCTSDGTCAESGSLGLVKKQIDGIKFSETTLLEDTCLALQQFALGELKSKKILFWA